MNAQSYVITGIIGLLTSWAGSYLYGKFDMNVIFIFLFTFGTGWILLFHVFILKKFLLNDNGNGDRA